MSTPIFVPVALSADEAKAVANACGVMITQLSNLISVDHPLITGTMKIEKEWRKATNHLLAE